MSFNSSVVKAYAGGALTTFVAPLAAYKGSQIALNTKVAGSITSTAGLVISCASATFNIEWESLVALVETDLTTNTIVVKTMWQGSDDGTNWVQIFDENCVALVGVAAAGTGGLVTTQYRQMLRHNPGMPYLRLAAINTVVTGAAGDNVTVAYNYRKRWQTN